MGPGVGSKLISSYRAAVNYAADEGVDGTSNLHVVHCALAANVPLHVQQMKGWSGAGGVGGGGEGEGLDVGFWFWHEYGHNLWSGRHRSKVWSSAHCLGGVELSAVSRCVNERPPCSRRPDEYSVFGAELPWATVRSSF